MSGGESDPVARMERSDIRVRPIVGERLPDFAALNPGYGFCL
jgi:hypothetical protein